MPVREGVSTPIRTATISAAIATRYSFTSSGRTDRDDADARGRQYPIRTASISAAIATRYSFRSSGPTNRSQRW